MLGGLPLLSLNLPNGGGPASVLNAMGSGSALVPFPSEAVCARGAGDHVWHPCWFPRLAFVSADSDDALLKMTITQQEFGRAGLPDLSSMTEEEQIAYAMQMSLQGAGECRVPALGPFPKGKPRRWPLCL